MLSVPSRVADGGPDVLEPLGVLSGVVLAAVNRASREALSTWLVSLDWGRVLRIFLGRHAAPPVARDSCEPGAPRLEQTAK